MNKPESVNASAPASGSVAHVVIVTDRDGEKAIKWKPTLEAAKTHRNRIAGRCERFGMSVKVYRLEEVPQNGELCEGGPQNLKSGETRTRPSQQ